MRPALSTKIDRRSPTGPEPGSVEALQRDLDYERRRSAEILARCTHLSALRDAVRRYCAGTITQAALLQALAVCEGQGRTLEANR